MLYEELPEKIKGTKQIFSLAQQVQNLQDLISNGICMKPNILLESLMNALTRVMLEDGKKSIDLSYHIGYVFYAFSSYLQFQDVLNHYKIPDMILKALHFELKRVEILAQEKKVKSIMKQSRLLFGKLALIRKP